MKIVIGAHDFFPNTVGGVATTTGQLVDAFVALGHDVSVVALTDGPEQEAPFRLYRNPNPLAMMRLYRTADILITTNLALKLIYPLLVNHRAFALQHHSESAFQLSHSFFSPDVFRRSVLARARHFMTSAYIGLQSGFPDYVVTPPFADLALIRSTPPLPPRSRCCALYVGRLEPEKGVRWLLDHWAATKSILGVEELRLVGSGSLSGAIAADIQAGTLKGVTLAGPLSRPDVAAEMRRAAFSIVPSLWNEPFGAVALESIAAGALTILTDRGGLPEAGGALGFYFDPDVSGTFENALESARRAHDAHLLNPATRATYEAAVNAHVAQFQPLRVAETIIDAMTEPPDSIPEVQWRRQSA